MPACAPMADHSLHRDTRWHPASRMRRVMGLSVFPLVRLAARRLLARRQSALQYAMHEETLQSGKIYDGDPSYWAKRRQLMYINYVAQFVCGFGRDARSILDVGPNGTPMVDLFDWIPTRHTVDLWAPYQSDTATGFKADFIKFNAPQRYDLALCLQVLEHIPDVELFTRKLFEVADHVIISVPYQWDAGRVADHVNDPIDKPKLRSWTGRRPTQYAIVSEAFKSQRRSRRLVCYYAPEGRRIRLRDAGSHRRPLPQSLLA